MASLLITQSSPLTLNEVRVTGHLFLFKGWATRPAAPGTAATYRRISLRLKKRSLMKGRLLKLHNLGRIWEFFSFQFRRYFSIIILEFLNLPFSLRLKFCLLLTENLDCRSYSSCRPESLLGLRVSVFHRKILTNVLATLIHT